MVDGGRRHHRRRRRVDPPGRRALGPDEELRRVLPVVERLAGGLRRAALDRHLQGAWSRARRSRAARRSSTTSAGCCTSPSLGRWPPRRARPLILMHTRGRSRGMYDLAAYGDVVGRGARRAGAAADRAVREGVPREAIILDPGLGFAKRAPHSFELLARLPELAAPRPANAVRTVPQVVPEGGVGGAAAGGARVGHRGGGDRHRPAAARTSSASTTSPDGRRRPGRRPAARRAR